MTRYSGRFPNSGCFDMIHSQPHNRQPQPKIIAVLHYHTMQRDTHPFEHLYPCSPPPTTSTISSPSALALRDPLQSRFREPTSASSVCLLTRTSLSGRFQPPHHSRQPQRTTPVIITIMSYYTMNPWHLKYVNVEALVPT